MKRLIFGRVLMIAILLTLLAACKTLKYIPSERIFNGLDLRKYVEVDFLFTPEMYSGEYLTVGVIDYVLLPEANYIKDSKTGANKWKVEVIKLEDAIDNVYKLCIEM